MGRRAGATVSAEQRARAKAVNFGIIYGLSAFGLANQLGIATGEAQETIDTYFARYRGVRRFIDETIAARAARRLRHAPTSGAGASLPDLRSRNRTLRQAAERMAVNTVIQGTAADLIKAAMLAVDRALESGGLARAHDPAGARRAGVRGAARRGAERCSAWSRRGWRTCCPSGFRWPWRSASGATGARRTRSEARRPSNQFA